MRARVMIDRGMVLPIYVQDENGKKIINNVHHPVLSEVTIAEVTPEVQDNITKGYLEDISPKKKATETVVETTKKGA